MAVSGQYIHSLIKAELSLDTEDPVLPEYFFPAYFLIFLASNLIAWFTVYFEMKSRQPMKGGVTWHAWGASHESEDVMKTRGIAGLALGAK